MLADEPGNLCAALMKRQPNSGSVRIAITRNEEPSTSTLKRLARSIVMVAQH
jgi:hypothetical protein